MPNVFFFCLIAELCCCTLYESFHGIATMGPILTLGTMLCATCKIHVQNICEFLFKILQVFLVSKE